MDSNNAVISYKKLILIIGGFIIGVVVISLLIMLLQQIFYRNPYGPEIKIDNFSEFYSSTPKEQQEVIFYQLYNSVSQNVTDTANIPTSGALVRADTVISDYNAETDVNYGSFIVDIAALEQSYRIQFEWSKDLTNPNLSGYATLITCPDAEYVIYPNFQCTDSLIQAQQQADALNAEYPIMKDLPIKIDYFKDGVGQHINYNIEGDLSTFADGSSSFKIIITDYTGGKYEEALERIRSLGYNPDDYVIEYLDYSEALNGYAF